MNVFPLQQLGVPNAAPFPNTLFSTPSHGTVKIKRFLRARAFSPATRHQPIPVRSIRAKRCSVKLNFCVDSTTTIAGCPPFLGRHAFSALFFTLDCALFIVLERDICWCYQLAAQKAEHYFLTRHIVTLVCASRWEGGNRSLMLERSDFCQNVSYPNVYKYSRVWG